MFIFTKGFLEFAREDLPAEARKMLSWLVVIGMILGAGVLVGAQTVSKGDFNNLADKVSLNTDAIKDYAIYSKVGLCLDLTTKENLSYTICLDPQTRDSYLDTRVKDLPQGSLP